MTETKAVRMNIVIVEDDAITRLWMQKKIEELNMGCRVAGTFPDGSQALEFIRGHEVDVVFTDVRMPVMDGMELLEYLRAEEFPIYKVIFSAYEEFDYVRWAMKLGAHEYVPKSKLTAESLRQILEDAGQWAVRRHMERGRPGADAEENIEKKRWIEREQQLREMLDQGDESGLVRLAAERHLDLRRLFFANLYFARKVPRETVLELLCLYLEQDGRRGECFQCESQEYSMIFNQENENRVPEDLKRLRAILESHLGAEVYLGVSRAGKPESEREQETRLLPELYRRALAARENRRFFGIADVVRYSQLLISATSEPDDLQLSQSVQNLNSMLREQKYDRAIEELDRFVAGMKRAVYFHPAYLHALGNRILSAYLYDVRKYPLSDEERRDVNGIELWLGWNASTLEELSQALLLTVSYLDGLLRKKSGNMSCSLPVRQTMWYVEENYERRVSLDEAAGYVHLSPTYLSALFKKETGIKFSTYLRKVRLEKARHMLTDSNLAIQEIADQAGFSDAAHLSRVFKERYGCSPTEYRRLGRRAGAAQPDWRIPDLR